MARKLGVKQVNISRLESRDDPRLSTLTIYIDAMGGRLHLIVEFPEARTDRAKRPWPGAGETQKESGVITPLPASAPRADLGGLARGARDRA